MSTNNDAFERILAAQQRKQKEAERIERANAVKLPPALVPQFDAQRTTAYLFTPSLAVNYRAPASGTVRGPRSVNRHSAVEEVNRNTRRRDQ